MTRLGALLEMLACPACRGRLRREAGILTCGGCGANYRVSHGVPDFRAEPGVGEGRRAAPSRLLDGVVSHPWIWDQVQRAYGLETDERWLRSRLADSAPGEDVLDVGAGTGTWRRLLPDGVRYVWLDTDARKLARFRRKYPQERAAVLADAARLPFADASFDAALVVGMAHHLDDRAFHGTLCELARVVRGRLVFLDVVRAPNRGALDRILWWLDQGAHARTPEQVLAAIESVLEVDDVDRYRHRFHYVGCTAHPRS